MRTDAQIVTDLHADIETLEADKLILVKCIERLLNAAPGLVETPDGNTAQKLIALHGADYGRTTTDLQALNSRG